MGYVLRYVVSRLLLVAILAGIAVAVAGHANVRLPFTGGGGFHLPSLVPTTTLPRYGATSTPAPPFSVPALRPAAGATAPPAGAGGH